MSKPFDPTEVGGKATRGNPKSTNARAQEAALSSGASDVQGIASNQLRSFVERIERIEEDQKVLADDKKEIYAEAKGNGFDTKVLRRVVALRKQDVNERLEFEAVLDLYLHAMGMAPEPEGGS